MSELRIHRSELTLNTEDEHIDVSYRGAPFTGIAFDETPHHRSETRYLAGYGHGRCTSTYVDGTPQDEYELAHGMYTGELRFWHRSGQLVHYVLFGERRVERRWSAQGVLVEELDDSGRRRRWYQDGVLREEMQDGGRLSVYTRAGELAFVRDRSVKVGERPSAPFHFNEPVMLAALDELAADPELHPHVFTFLHATLSRSRNAGIEVLKQLLAHPVASVVSTALANVSAAKVHELRPVAAAMVDDPRVPLDPETGLRRHDRTIGADARETLAMLDRARAALAAR